MNKVNEKAGQVLNKDTSNSYIVTDDEMRSLDIMCINETTLQHPWWYNIKYLFAGIVFGIVLVKAEVISWFRIQEMFRLQSFHMYGVIGSAVVVGMISVFLIHN